MYVKPAPGVLVRDPLTMMPMPEIGRHVENSQHWWRMLAEGAVIECAPPSENASARLSDPEPIPDSAASQESQA